MATSKVAVIGSGMVGETLADGFLKYGHEVRRASRDPSKLEEWKAAAGEKASLGKSLPLAFALGLPILLYEVSRHVLGVDFFDDLATAIFRLAVR